MFINFYPDESGNLCIRPGEHIDQSQFLFCQRIAKSVYAKWVSNHHNGLGAFVISESIDEIIDIINIINKTNDIINEFAENHGTKKYNEYFTQWEKGISTPLDEVFFYSARKTKATCQKCKKEITKGIHEPRKGICHHHIIPKSIEINNSLKNRLLLCYQCHVGKGSSIHTFLKKHKVSTADEAIIKTLEWMHI